jgi:ABC-2 type transport system permease protein
MNAARPGLLLVAERELRWMVRDRLALLLVVIVPLFGFGLLSWTFSHAVIRNIRVDIVDADRSPTSEQYVQAVSAAPGVSVAWRSTDLNGALHSIRSGRAIAAVYIPPDFEKDVLALKRPQIVTFYNRQYFTPGNNAASALSSAISSQTAALVTQLQTKGRSFEPGQLLAEQYVLSNPALNYAQFLLRAILPTVLHIVTAIAGGYAVGSEYASRDPAEWLRTAGGSPLAAIVGKLAPLLGIFIIIMAGCAVIIDAVYHVPFRGNSVIMAAAAILLLIAYLSLGALLQLLVRNLAVGLSLTGIICSPAFGFAGVGFPVFAMNGFSKAWGDALPLRWYIQILFDQAVRGLPPQVSATPFAVLGGLAILYFLLAWLRLRSPKSAVRSRHPVMAVAPVSGPPRVGRAFLLELRAAFGNKTVFGLIVMAPVIYGVFYPQPYLGQLLKRIPVAVVDQDRTELSRDVVQALNADEALSVNIRANTLADAQAALDRRQVYAIIGIPEGTSREVLKGNPAHMPTYIDAAYFLMYSRMGQGIGEALQSANVAIAASGARLDGSLAHAAITKNSPVEAVSEPLFNPTGGYASYVVPAAFMLILQQSQFMAIAMLGGSAFQAGGSEARRRRGRARAIVGQALAHLVLALPGFALFLIVLPRVYGFSTLGSVRDLCLMVIPFVLAVSFLAQLIGSFFKRGESAVILFIATSLPLFFLVGVSWPADAIPTTLRNLSRLFPSTSAIDGLVRINQMGATLNDVSTDWLSLWALACVYGALAVVAGFVRNRRTGHEI